MIIQVNLWDHSTVCQLCLTEMWTWTHTQNQTDLVLNHLQCCHKLNSADECQRLSRSEVELDRVQEVCVVHLDIHKHIQHLNARCGVYGDCRETETKQRQMNNFALLCQVRLRH